MSTSIITHVVKLICMIFAYVLSSTIQFIVETFSHVIEMIKEEANTYASTQAQKGRVNG